MLTSPYVTLMVVAGQRTVLSLQQWMDNDTADVLIAHCWLHYGKLVAVFLSPVSP